MCTRRCTKSPEASEPTVCQSPANTCYTRVESCRVMREAGRICADLRTPSRMRRRFPSRFGIPCLKWDTAGPKRARELAPRVTKLQRACRSVSLDNVAHSRPSPHPNPRPRGAAACRRNLPHPRCDPCWLDSTLQPPPMTRTQVSPPTPPRAPAS